MLQLLFVIIATLAYTSSAANFTIPFKFPTFKQCDQLWANDLMDTKTICQVGCLMSSTAMGLAGTDIAINGTPSDPGVLNTWLKANGGYDGSNDLIESVVPKIDPARIAWVSSRRFLHKLEKIADEFHFCKTYLVECVISFTTFLYFL